MEKFIRSLVPTAFIAAIILFFYWIADLNSSFSGSPSGWWWFGCLLVGVFAAEYDSNE